MYEVELVIYRNCECPVGSPNCSNFDELAVVSIHNGNRELFGTLLMELDTLNEKEVIPLQTEELCIIEEPTVCVERSTGYKETVELPPAANGYTLTYTRCCRNPAISNLRNPADLGNTYSITIPPQNDATCNSSPVFKNLPPIILCAGYPFQFDHSAVDPDGDELVYELCTPFDYPLNPSPPDEGGYGPAIRPGDAAPPPPYDMVPWGDYFSAENQIGGNPRMTINPTTGLLEAYPDYVGFYVIGICVSEFRNGVLLNTSIRDYQLKIVDCNVVQAEIESDDIDAQGNFILKECEDYSVEFINLTEGAENYFWQFGDVLAGGADTSSLKNPSYEYPDTGKYEVTLIANPGKLCADTASIFLELYPRMVVDFDWAPACANTAMQFTDISNTDFGDVVNYNWSFGDGNIASTEDPQNIFELGGDYDVSLIATNSLGCTLALSKQVYVTPSPQTDFGNSPICIDQQPIDFTDLSVINIGNIVNREWLITDAAGNTLLQTNDLNIEYTFTTPGDYFVQLTATGDEGCVEVATSSVTLYEKLEVEAGPAEDVCIGSSVELNATVNGIPATYMWETNVPTNINDNTLQNPTITPNQNTIATVYATDPNGCTNADSLLITSRALPTVEAGRNDTLCIGDSYNLNGIVELPDNGNGQISYQWSPDSFINNTTISNPMVNPQDDITYFLTATENEFNCANSDTVFIRVLKPVNAAANDNVACELVPVQLMATGGDFYNWQPPLGLNDPSANNPIAILDQTTNYIVTVSNACFSADVSVLVEVLPAPNVDAGIDVTLDIGDIIQLNAIVENNATTIDWQPNVDILSGGDTANPELQPLRSRDYVVTATSGFGCSLSDTVSVTVNNIFNLWVPNAFSPNQDGSNDAIGITPKGIKDLNIFRIYNRWGQKVFETNDINQTWDGTFKGKPQELGVYVYYAIGITFLDELFKDKGNITLIR